jgi:hypothetical protein
MFCCLVTCHFSLYKTLFVDQKHDFRGVTFCTHKKDLPKMYINMAITSKAKCFTNMRNGSLILQSPSFNMKDMSPMATKFYILGITG